MRLFKVFCCNDDLALGALFECHRLGISVPERISLIGFNDLEYAACAYPSLTSVLTPRYEMGRKTAEIVLEIIRGSGKRPQRKRIDIGFRIMERESTREPTGSPVAINVSTIAVRISRSRFPIVPGGAITPCIILSWAPEVTNVASHSSQLNTLDAKT